MYLTASDLMDRFDAAELAQVAPPDSLDRVEAALMRAVILGESTAAYTADEVAAATEGKTRIESAIDDAGQEADGWLSQRYALPLDPAPALLVRLVANMARFHLHDDQATDEIRKRYEDAIKTLRHISEGRISLGVNDPSPASSIGPKATKSRDDRKFTDDTLAGY